MNEQSRSYLRLENQHGFLAKAWPYVFYELRLIIFGIFSCDVKNYLTLWFLPHSPPQNTHTHTQTHTIHICIKSFHMHIFAIVQYLLFIYL